MVGGDPVDGLEYQPPPPQQGAGQGGPWRPRAERLCGADSGRDRQVCTSFDGKWEALIENFNVFLRPAGSTEPADGAELRWLGRQLLHVALDRLVAGFQEAGGLSHAARATTARCTTSNRHPPTSFSRSTRRSCTASRATRWTSRIPALFDVATKQETEIDQALFPNAYNLTPPVWWKDSRGFTFEYNQRGHQVYRVIEVDAQTGKARALIDEDEQDVHLLQPAWPRVSPGGRRYRHDLNDGKEIIWTSERDGWEHLYLYDGVTGKVKNQITKGEWVVRKVDRVDEDKRQIWFQAGGMNPGQDPYFTHYYRINFDGTGLTKLTEADGNHTVTFSPDRKYYVDTWSRVDLPPVAQLRRTDDRKVVMDLEQGRCHGAARPRREDAGGVRRQGARRQDRHLGHHRPADQFRSGEEVSGDREDLRRAAGLVRAQDLQRGSAQRRRWRSSGSSWCRSTAWGPAIARRHSTTSRARIWATPASRIASCGTRRWRRSILRTTSRRVGIYGTSAGGQNSLGGMLFHPEFYKVAVTNSGCHDNRMDKIWWNEQWMGWPLGPQYAASSNVDNAYRLQGKVLIIVGEMDTNVDPASTLQVVNALVKANKHFDMLFIPGQNHGVGVLATQHYRDDYFVHNLLGVEPPDWNRVTLPAEGGN